MSRYKFTKIGNIIPEEHRCIECKLGPKQVNFSIMSTKVPRPYNLCNICRNKLFRDRHSSKESTVAKRIKEYFNE